MEETKVKRRTKKAADEPLAFEKALEELEDVTRKLESGEGSLEEMIALYEKGMELVKQCNARLDAYEKKIEKLTTLSGEDA